VLVIGVDGAQARIGPYPDAGAAETIAVRLAVLAAAAYSGGAVIVGYDPARAHLAAQLPTDPAALAALARAGDQPACPDLYSRLAAQLDGGEAAKIWQRTLALLTNNTGGDQQ
jgi:hypothetical protein